MGRGSFFTKQVQDDKAVFLTAGQFGIVGDGIHDDTKAIQEAVAWVWRTYGFGIVFLPEGKYLISDTIYMPKAVRLIGYGKERPCIVLKDNAEGFDRPYPEDKGGFKYMLWFTDNVPEKGEEPRDANPGTFYSALSNVDIRVGTGNPYAVALRTHYAQHSFISHIHIDVDSGMAGIYDCGNEMEDIEITGGEYGIITTKCSPGWPFVMVDTVFNGQRKAAIRSQEGGLTIVRITVKNTPVFLTVNKDYIEKLYIEDGQFEHISDAAIVMSCEDNALNQYNVCRLACRDVPVFVRYQESGEELVGSGEVYQVKEYTHGICVADVDGGRELKTIFKTDILEALPERTKTDIPVFPPMDEWVNLKELGAKGDDVSDDTEVLRMAIEQYQTIFVPQGWYHITDTIELKKNTVLIGLNPVSTQFILPDNTECFGGFGNPKPLFIAPRNGECIMNGIGISTGGKNPRAVAVKWMAGEKSYMNDVKFIGGHGTMKWGSNAHQIPYNESRTADSDITMQWDGQYPSLWVTDGGGGVFKDIWSASTYASAGLYVSDTDTKARIYAMSLEHHMRCEARFERVSNWKVYGLQTEEEKAEGRDALPLELAECRNMVFANLYMFRVIFVSTPFPCCVKMTDCESVEFLNFHNFSQMKYTINDALLDINSGCIVKPWQMARLFVSGQVQRRPVDLSVPVKLYGGFRFADGGCVNSQGDFYFLDSMDKKIYKIDGRTLKLKKVADLPFKVNSLAVDTKDNLIVAGEFSIPMGAVKDGKEVVNELPYDSYGTSYGYWYNRQAAVVVFSLDENNADEPICLLPKVERNCIKKPEKVLYAGNRWRDMKDFREVVVDTPPACYVAPDGVTIIPDQYDLIRACCMGEAYPGKEFYCVDEYYKRTFRLNVLEDGRLSSPEVVVNEGEFCVLPDRKGDLYICDGQVRVFQKDGTFIREIEIPERPATASIGGKDKNILFVAARGGIYAVRIET